MNESEIVRLASVPGREVQPTDFTVDAIEDQSAQTLCAGQVEVEAELFGLNAGLRSRLGSGVGTTLGPSIGPGDTPQSDAVARITRSNDDDYAVGEQVVALLPWRSTAIVSTQGLRRLDQATAPIDAMTLVGHVGATAFAGLVHVGQIGSGDVVWISAAAGGGFLRGAICPRIRRDGDRKCRRR